MTTEKSFTDDINLLENVYEHIIPKYHEINDMIVSLLDFNPDQQIKVVDFGVGLGSLAQKIFQIFPLATIIGVDSHQDILQRSHERLLQYRDQYVPLHADLEDSSWVNQVGEINAAVSAFTLDYLPIEKHHQLVDDTFELLLPHGRFVTCEFFKSDDNLINRIFHDVEIKFVHKAMKEGIVNQEQIEQISQISFLKQPHHVCTLETKIDWLRMAGFEKIEVPWKFLNLAIVSAVRG